MLVLACWTQASAQADDDLDPKTLILTDDQSSYPLGLHLELLEDPGGELTIEDVTSPEYAHQFWPSQVEVPNFGFSDSAYWVRLNLYNENRLNDHWLLGLGFANMQFVDLYTPLADGDGFEVKQTGSQRPVSTRDIFHPRIIFALIIPTQSQQTIYLRFQSGASMTLPLTLSTFDAFWIKTEVELVLYALFFGVLIALLVYHLFLVITLREVSYLFFVILLASLLVATLSYYGYLELYLFPNLYSLKPLYFPLSVVSVFASIVLFSNAFLEIRTRAPKLHRINMALVTGWGVLFFLTPIVSYHIFAVLVSSWAMISLVVALVAGMETWRQGFRPARFFLIAWFGALAGLIMLMLVRQGRIPSTFFTENAYLLGLAWMAVCWSIALADRINMFKAETEGANRALRGSERRLSQILEGLPLGVVVYGKDFKPNFVNRRVNEILSNPVQNIRPDLSAGRTLAEAMNYYSFRVGSSDEAYSLEKFPVYQALQGEPANADDIEADLVDRRVPLEVWASPVKILLGTSNRPLLLFRTLPNARNRKWRCAPVKRFFA